MVRGFAPARHYFDFKGEPLGWRGEGPLIEVDLPRRRRAGIAENDPNLSLVEADLSIAEGGNGHPLAFSTSLMCLFVPAQWRRKALMPYVQAPSSICSCAF